jgi:hypothetical protein
VASSVYQESLVEVSYSEKLFATKSPQKLRPAIAGGMRILNLETMQSIGSPYSRLALLGAWKWSTNSAMGGQKKDSVEPNLRT